LPSSQSNPPTRMLIIALCYTNVYTWLNHKEVRGKCSTPSIGRGLTSLRVRIFPIRSKGSALELDYGNGRTPALVRLRVNALDQRMRREKVRETAPQRASAVAVNHAHLGLAS
jgi:hypothetical protein